MILTLHSTPISELASRLRFLIHRSDITTLNDPESKPRTMEHTHMVLDAELLDRLSATMDEYATIWNFITEFIDYHPDYIALLDKDMNFVKVNKKIANILNKPIDEIEGRHITELVPDVESSGRLDIYQHVYDSGEAISFRSYSNPELYGDKTFLLRVIKINGGIALIGTNVAELNYP